MKKTKIVMTLLACVFLSGCMKFRLRLDVSPKGKVDETAAFLMDVELLQLGEGSLDENLESMRESVLEENPDAQVEIVREEDEEGEVTYAGVSVREENSKEYTMTVKNRRVTIEIPVKKVMNDFESAIGEEDIAADELKEAGFEMTLDVNMPRTPETNAGTVEGTTVRVDLLALPAGTDTIIVSSKTGEMNPFVIGAILGGIALGAGVYYAQDKNKKAAALSAAAGAEAMETVLPAAGEALPEEVREAPANMEETAAEEPAEKKPEE